MIKFGTDGWRALIADDFTVENVRICAQGTATMLEAQGLGGKPLVVGYDTRFGSERFAREVAEVAAGNGMKVLLADRPAPTPTISYNVVSRGAGGGVVITASHNPPEWNGYKFKPDYGGSASPDVVEQLERQIAEVEQTRDVSRLPVDAAQREGLVEMFNPAPPYLANIHDIVDIEAIRKAGLTIVVDSMHGAGAGYFRELLGGGASTITELRGERNPAFPGMAQPEPVASNITQLMDHIANNRAHVGLATDGDADRLGVVDETGQFLTTLESFALLCYYQLEVLGNRGPLVRSITMTGMIDKLGQAYGIPVFDTPVGFKYLGPVMMREDALAAGEESGGYAFKGNIPERDGILSGLMILDLIVQTGKTLSELKTTLTDLVGPHSYQRIDLHFDEGQRAAILDRVTGATPSVLGGKNVAEIDTRDGFRFVLEGGYWTLVRFSGTEPVLRIYAEAESSESVAKLLDDARALTGV